MRILAGHALLPEGWRESVAVTIADGRIDAIELSASSLPGDMRIPALLPALSNLHSHTFQRGMAGMSEVRGAASDSFWTWREVMYKFVDHLTPDDIEAIAAMAFVEMQEGGFAAVAEFHYVHHQHGGGTYANIAELSGRIFNAARQTGIGEVVAWPQSTLAAPALPVPIDIQRFDAEGFERVTLELAIWPRQS